MAIALSTPGVWSAQDTTPAEIEAALLRLMRERHGEGLLQAPARVLNFVVVIDQEFKGEILSRLDRISRDNPARTILVEVDDDKPDLDATATLINESTNGPGSSVVFRERIEIVCGTGQLSHLDTIVYPVLAGEVGTVVWSPHGHPEALDSMRGLASTILLDSHDFYGWRSAIARTRDLAEHAEIVDLAWLRSLPWRERLAAAFDPEIWRNELQTISSVELRIDPRSTMSALLYVGWLASRLEWQPHVLDLDDPKNRTGYATGPAGQIEIALIDDTTMPVPGLAGLTIETTTGMTLELNRAAGGLRASRTLADGTHHAWTVLGASRGEDGILAHGVTNAMLPDELFRPALEAACAFGGRASIERAER